MPVNEQRMELAIDAWFAIPRPEDRPSIRQHAKEYLVNRATFARRVNGGRKQANSHEHQQRLSDTQEDWLIQWIKEMDERGHPPSHTRAREMAAQICVANGDTKPLGLKWLNQFMQRHPSVRSVIGRVIKASRIDGTRPEVLQAHFDLFHRTKVAYDVTQANCWNMDEHELPLSDVDKRMVFQGFNKAGKAINNGNIWKAQHEAERRKFEAQPESMATTKRKRVEKNPDTTFASIDEIIAAQEAQAEQEREKALKQARIDHKKLENAAAIAARAMRAKDFKSCLYQWQIDDYLSNS